MSDISPNLQLPYLMPDQAQKHVTHNEALQRLDGLSQITLLDILAAPPASPTPGATYGVGPGATGVWFGHDGELALYQDGDWLFTKPRRGWIAWFEKGARLSCFDGTAWTDIRLPANARTDMLGINATADTANRLAISAEASLFNHAGAGHQLKLNKANSGATASLLFQTGFSGRAEIGLAGNNDLSVKLSPDGGVWNTGLSIDSAGVTRMPNRPACRTSLLSTTLTPAAGSFTGFQGLAVNQGRFALGDVVSPGTGQRLVVPATGLYLILLTAVAISSTGHEVALMQNSANRILTVKGNAATATLGITGMTIVNLAAGDTLMLQHAGTAQLDFGPGKTELTLVML